MAHPRIPIRCQDCGFLMVEFEQKATDSFTPHAYMLFGIEPPDPGLRAAGIAVAVCSKCGGKTEFPTKYLLQ